MFDCFPKVDLNFSTGTGLEGSAGGEHGTALGRGVYGAVGTVNIRGSTFLGNQSIGGAGANKGFIGAALGGGIVCGNPYDTTAN